MLVDRANEEPGMSHTDRQSGTTNDGAAQWTVPTGGVQGACSSGSSGEARASGKLRSN
ncbi:hypothetical protein MES5069_200044 [Mesorhizobium escarrei]|uniref:Uncharacterized protein n=1 Tax=Mesorhizobium escarrei TaxID=666018 RepID=A0ABM9DPD8_9HYPH|nr:hypothetical protein MES5069_200044 [Mesorhizobium escarrei]